MYTSCTASCSAATSSSPTPGRAARAGGRRAARARSGAPRRRRVAERPSSGRSGRAGPPAAGRCPRARSGSRSRAAGTARQLARRAVDGDLPLGHCLEQRGLRLRHRAVDLVDEHDVREDRPWPELEVALALVVDGEPGDVGRLQVGRALDARRRRALDRAAIARARTVLAVPGTSSRSTWPSQASAARTSRISLRLPWTTVSMLSSSRSATLAACAKRSEWARVASCSVAVTGALLRDGRAARADGLGSVGIWSFGRARPLRL